MGRRLLMTLVIAALAVAAWWIARPTPQEDLGLVVHVFVADQAGEPLENAQVQRVYAPGWRVVDADGRLRLTHLLLREGEEVSAVALRQAVQVRAPYYSLRQGFEPEITLRRDGTWAMRFPLHHHGVMRLHVRGTHLGRPKAYPEPDRPLQRWEAMDAGNVARPGAPAAFRIYPGLEHVVVRLTGEKDMHGATGVATRRFFLEPPGPGFIVERTIVPDDVQPILGQVVLPEGPPPPAMRGEIRITELAVGGRRIAHDPVPVEADGSFVVRTVGKGRYELSAVFDFLTSPEPVLCEAGDVIELKGAKCVPWVNLLHPSVDSQAPGLRFRVGRRREAAHTHVPVVHLGERSLLALPGDGTWHVRALTRGDSKRPPVDLHAEVESREAVGVEATATIEAAPHGTVVVHVGGEGWGSAEAATVTVDGRAHTLLRGLAERVEVPHVRAGSVWVEVDWNDATAAPLRPEVEVEPGGTKEVEVTCEAGGWVALRGRGPAAAWEAGDMVLRLTTEWVAGIGATEWGLSCVRLNAAPVWSSDRALPPGEYQLAFPPGGFLGGVKVDTDRFTVEAGKTTVISFEVPE